MNVGHSKVVVTCEKDAFEPTEIINLKTYVDNSNCSRNLDKITANLVRRIEVKDGIWSFAHDEILKT